MASVNKQFTERKLFGFFSPMAYFLFVPTGYLGLIYSERLRCLGNSEITASQETEIGKRKGALVRLF